MTTLRFSRLTDTQTCQHQDCRHAAKGARTALYMVEVGEVRTVKRILCVNHAAALAAEQGQPFPPVSLDASR